jgi:L-asparaginase
LHVIRHQPIIAKVWRGPVCESVHIAYFAETDAEGTLLAAGGVPDLVTTLRSAAKPLQAIPLITLPNADSLGLTDEELAICCASHPGLPRHTALVASVLALSGFIPDNLVCGFAGNPPTPLKHGCSGNHAALLAGAKLLEAPLEGYEKRDHPIEVFITKLIAEMAGAGDMQLATDGCGVPTFGLHLQEMARTFAELTRPDSLLERIPRVMGANPELIGNEKWADVRLMQVTKGRIIAKTGAEGLLCLGIPGKGQGMAVKMLDGSTRALGAVTIKVLVDRGWITEEEAAHPLLAELRKPAYRAPDGEVISEILV